MFCKSQVYNSPKTTSQYDLVQEENKLIHYESLKNGLENFVGLIDIVNCEPLPELLDNSIQLTQEQHEMCREYFSRMSLTTTVALEKNKLESLLPMRSNESDAFISEQTLEALEYQPNIDNPQQDINIIGAGIDAINKRNLNKLNYILGPNFYHSRLSYLAKAKDNYWQMIIVKTKCVVLLEVSLVMRDFAKEVNYPENLNRTQHRMMKEKLINVLRLECNKISQLLSLWRINDSLKDIAGFHIKRVLLNEIEKINGSSLIEIRDIFYEMKQSYLALHLDYHKYKNQLNTVNEQYTLEQSEEKYQQIWENFNQNYAIQNLDENASIIETTDFNKTDDFVLELSAQHLNNLQQSKFSDLSLNDPILTSFNRTDILSLLDHAISLYCAPHKDAQFQNQVFGIIKILCEHGAKPSIELKRNLDWRLLIVILQNCETPSHFSELVRQELLAYCQNNQNYVWHRQLFTNVDKKNARRYVVQDLLLCICAAQSALNLDEALIKIISRAQGQFINESNENVLQRLNISLREANSELLQRLNRVLLQKESGQLIAATSEDLSISIESFLRESEGHFPLSNIPIESRQLDLEDETKIDRVFSL